MKSIKDISRNDEQSVFFKMVIRATLESSFDCTFFIIMVFKKKLPGYRNGKLRQS